MYQYHTSGGLAYYCVPNLFVAMHPKKLPVAGSVGMSENTYRTEYTAGMRTFPVKAMKIL